MKQCPKCSSQYGDDAKLCRICGAILETVAEEPPQTSDPLPHEEGHAQETALSQQPSWKCPHCGESVPGAFEVCWNCGTSQDGASDPSFAKEPDAAPGKEEPDSAPWEPEPSEQPPAAKPIHRQCPTCGSSKMIPNTRIIDQGDSSTGDLRVVVYAHPDALIFKDRLYERLVADICGDCGRVELKVEHPSVLYAHYLQSRAKQDSE
jgi:hypothetical protein